MAIMRMKNGAPAPMRNAEFIPVYYFIPRRILEACGAELNALPRNPHQILRSKTACDLIESDLFRLLIVDAVAFLVWPYMGFTEYMEIYSGDDPAWRLAHCPEIWVQKLTDQGILPTAESFLRKVKTRNDTYRRKSVGVIFMPQTRSKGTWWRCPNKQRICPYRFCLSGATPLKPQ